MQTDPQTPLRGTQSYSPLSWTTTSTSPGRFAPKCGPEQELGTEALKAVIPNVAKRS